MAQVQNYNCWNCCDTCSCPGRPDKLFATFSPGFLPLMTLPDGIRCPCASGTIELNYKFGAPTHFLPSYILYGWPPIPPSPPSYMGDSMSPSTVARLYEFYVGDGVGVSEYPTIGSCNMYYLNPDTNEWLIPEAPYDVARIKYIRLFCTKDHFYGSTLATWGILIELTTVGFMFGELVEKSLVLQQYLGQIPQENCNPVLFHKYMYRPPGMAEYDVYQGFTRSAICYGEFAGYPVGLEFINFMVTITE